MVQVIDKQIQENGLGEFQELMKEVATLSKEDKEKVCIFVQGFMARDLMDKNKVS